jgi:hypothetical protein
MSLSTEYNKLVSFSTVLTSTTGSAHVSLFTAIADTIRKIPCKDLDTTKKRNISANWDEY